MTSKRVYTLIDMLHIVTYTSKFIKRPRIDPCTSTNTKLIEVFIIKREV